MKYSAGRDERGFTLVESLIAILLLTLVITAAINLFFSARIILSFAVQKRAMIEMLSSRLEEIKRDGYLNLPESGTVQTVNINVGGVNAQETTTVTDEVDYKKVKVEVSWRQAGKNTSRKVELTTYMVP